MMDIERFDCGSGGVAYCQGCYTMEKNELGDYVRYEDYEALQERLRATETERDELRHAQDSLIDKLAVLTAYKEVAEKQKPVQWVCELSSNPWPHGGGTRKETRQQAIDFINSEYNHCKYDTVSPIYRLPVPAEWEKALITDCIVGLLDELPLKPAVAVPDDQEFLLQALDKIIRWHQSVSDLPQCIDDDVSQGYCVSYEKLEELENLIPQSAYDFDPSAAPSHSHQSAELSEIEILQKALVNLKGYDLCIDKNEWQILLDNQHQFAYGRTLAELIDWAKQTVALNRCPSHESEHTSNAPDRADKYFYKVNDCKADSPQSPDCKCWHDYGTGPLPNLIKEGEQGGAV